MSTRIYNGFCMKNLKADELIEFVKELREQIRPMFDEVFCKAVAKKCEEIIKGAMKINYEYDGLGNSREKVDTFLRKWYNNSLSHERLYRDNDISIEDIRKKLDYPFIGGILDMAINILKAEHSWSERFFCSDLRSEIAFIPCNNRRLLFMTFGEEFTNIIVKFIEQNNDFVQRYELKEYGYWNNTDRPENVTAREWNQRDKDWSNVTSASKCGLCSSDLFDPYYMYNEFAMDDDGRMEKVQIYMSTAIEITATLAHDLTLNHYITNDSEYDGSYHTSSGLAIKYSEKLKNGNIEMFSYADKLEKELSETIKDKTSSELLSMNILEMFPEYMQQINNNQEV